MLGAGEVGWGEMGRGWGGEEKIVRDRKYLYIYAGHIKRGGGGVSR